MNKLAVIEGTTQRDMPEHSYIEWVRILNAMRDVAYNARTPQAYHAAMAAEKDLREQLKAQGWPF